MTPHIRLGDGTRIPVLHEDRAVIAIDKPPGWLLAPAGWDRTGRNLQRALESCLQGRDFWARSRRLEYLRFVHRLDADTSGVLLLARTPPALRLFSRLFESRAMHKTYLAVVQGVPQKEQWTCLLPVGRDPNRPGAMCVNGRDAREATTRFSVLAVRPGTCLLAAEPLTGRTHQIRVHLAAAGHPIVGDRTYGETAKTGSSPGLALRAIQLEYEDPFKRRRVRIKAPAAAFLRQHGFPDSACREEP